ncbi:uncharacterized protein I303_103270 [Kwoniella dejecticola CBS 10117]|uniref:Major facilitator superfamily (MFS) profile domain-containing protein n=1 Tax=Kwoniella dejecticola CBS 10117 TaxID=1296121 RepID=A0A1A6A695_9TREE|nr:uncharacterized protein I303_03293 [Kwoniella dejecticola CBS 10117]OBR85582.1 hypothetical protein I303_03293 [Kwoniella dejecticola CBS 10117]
MTSVLHTSQGPSPIPGSPDEKSLVGIETPLSSASLENTSGNELTWTEVEERAVVRKIDFFVLPLLFLGFYVFQLERGNISNALTDGFLKSVGITQDQFNTGQSLLYLGIILLEIPSNYMLQRVGPRIWISFQVLAFGLVGTLQAFQKGYGGYLATRIMLGVTECGYIPGALFIISTFYKRSELATRNSIFFIGNGLATATSGLLAYAILPMGTRYPQHKGWQWLMIVEGCMALFVAVLLLLFLPASPHTPTSLFLPIRLWSPRQEEILVARMVKDDEKNKRSSHQITIKDIIGTLSNWRIWPHVLIAICLISQTGALGTYGPSLIKGFNFDTLTANALSSVSGWIGLVTTASFGFFSDRTRIRGPVVITGLTLVWAFWVAFQQKSLSTDRWLKYGLQIMVQGFSIPSHPINATWLSLNCKSPQERSIAMALFIMAANSGALVGSQLLRGDDAPLYKRGFKVCLCLVSLGLLTSIIQHVQYRLSNRRLSRRKESQVESLEEQVEHVEWKYTI